MGQLNQRQESKVIIDNFAGGYAGAKAIGNLNSNEAQNLENIIVLPGGKGFRNMPGTKQISPSGGSGQNIWDFTVGVLASRQRLPGYSDDALKVVVLASKTSDNNQITAVVWNIDTSSLTVGGQMNYDSVDENTEFTMFPFNDSIIITSRIDGNIDGGTDAPPWKITYGGSASVLQDGVAPQGKVGIGWNNRAWIGSTTSEPSKLFYSILNDATDWNGTGSGFVEPDPEDGDELTAITPISNNILLYFKQNKIFQVVGRSHPFAVFELFRGIGCIGKDALVNVDGIVYFITPKGQMRITDGSRIYDDKDIPSLSNADDLWAQIPVNRRPYIRGTHHKGKDYDWIIWLVSLGSAQTSNNQCIIWDLKNKCWLQGTEGFTGNNITSSSDGRTFLGSLDGGRIFECVVEDYHKDDTNSTPAFDGNNRIIAPTDSATMTWKWRSDDYAESLQDILQVRLVNVMAKYGASGSLDLNYRYDGGSDSSDISKTLDSSSVNYSSAVYRPLGRGDTFGFELNSNSEVNATISKISLIGSPRGQKDPGTR